MLHAVAARASSSTLLARVHVEDLHNIMVCATGVSAVLGQCILEAVNWSIPESYTRPDAACASRLYPVLHSCCPCKDSCELNF